MPKQLTHNETMFKLLDNIRVTIEHAQRTIHAHAEENGVLDRFTVEYLTRARNEIVRFSSEYNHKVFSEYNREAFAESRARKERDEVLSEYNRDVMELEPE